MEFDDTISRPPSTKELLYEQVEEQSDFCDVTIQVGQWKKKFHLCVLVTSPFFECIRRNDFKEKHTGLVKLDFATPATAEAAIMFLYGKRPVLTEDNVTAILELAEFMLIPNLKSKCVNFLTDVPITEENCMKMLELSSLYGFEFSQCYDYIRANLPDILREDDAVLLTKDSVMTLLTDPLLSYLLAEEKFQFAVRWAKGSQHNRDAFEEVFKAIDIESLDEEFLETVVLQDPLVSEMSIANPKLHVRTPAWDHRALIFPKLLKNDKMVCFDIESEQWIGIEADLLKGTQNDFILKKTPVEGLCRPRDVYRVYNRASGYTIHLQDLHSKECTKKTVSTSNNTHTGRFSTYGLSRDMFVAISNEKTELHKSINKNKRTVLRRVYEYTTIIYCGQLQHKDIVIDPIFTIRHTHVASVCINEHSVIALLSMEKDILHMYDMSSCQFDTVALNVHIDLESVINYGLRVAAKEDGFVLYNKESVLDISRKNGTDVTKRYAVQKTRLEHDRKWNRSIYIFSNNIWFHILRRERKGKIEVSCLNHDALMGLSHTKVTWNQLPSPPEDVKLLDANDAFIVELPKAMLRCHFDCPHCPQQKKQMEKRQEERLASMSLAEGADLYFYSDTDDDLPEDHHHLDDYHEDYEDYEHLEDPYDFHEDYGFH